MLIAKSKKNTLGNETTMPILENLKEMKTIMSKKPM